MTIGDGIFWSTLIIVVALAIWRATVNKKWKTIGKVVAVFLGIGVLGAGAYWRWDSYENRPRIVTELAGITLGMAPVDVTLALGEPSRKNSEEGDSKKTSYDYGKSYNDNYLLSVVFDEKDGQSKAIIICEEGGYSDVLGFSSSSSEADVTEKLGAAGKVSIKSDGLEKIITYPQWKAAYIVEKNEVKGVCISESGSVRFRDELTTTAAGDTAGLEPSSTAAQ